MNFHQYLLGLKINFEASKMLELKNGKQKDSKTVCVMFKDIVYGLYVK